MKSLTRFLLLVCLILTPAWSASAQNQGYYRFPTLSGSTLVFASEGDLWQVHLAGGQATRLTTHPGEEAYPVLSPDGSRVAFAASYEGTSELYVMPVTGGLPTRLTWDGSSGTRPVSWTADGRIVYRTNRSSGLPNSRLAIIDPDSKAREEIPLDQAADGVYADDGTLWFVRLPRQGSNSRWYKGGTAQILWKMVPGAGEAELVSGDWPGTTKQPRLAGDRVYFLSDRGGMGMNVWSMTTGGADLTRHTDFMDWDIQEHTLSGTNIVFRVGADLYRLDLTSGRAEGIPITLLSDFDQRRDTWEEKPMDYLASTAVSPDGDRVALVARGEVFVAPAGEEGRIVHVSADSGVRYRSALFAPDGKSLLALSDKSGEVEWWRVPADGIGEPKQITNGPAMLRGGGVVSPDGKWLVHTDYDRQIWLVNLGSGHSKRIAESSILWSGKGPSATWSADSRYVAYETTAANRMSSVHVHEVGTGATHLMTSDRYEDHAPVFSTDGNWLFFASDRALVSSVGSPWGARAPAPHFDKQTMLYAIPLRHGVAFPFSPNNELSPEKPDTTVNTGPVRFDLGSQIRELPGVPRGEYTALKATAKRLFWVDFEDEPTLMALDLKPDAKPLKLVEGISDYDVSADGKKIVVRKGETIAVIDASSGAGAKLDEGAVKLSGWRVPISPVAEWRQIFVDAWRMHRDYFWDPNMLGVDWPAIRAQYEPLVSRVGSREELTDIQAQMVSHLSLLHSNAGGGDTRSGSDDVMPASLGATFEPVADGFRVTHVFLTDPDLPGEQAPLARPEVRVTAGSVILSVDGDATAGAPDLGIFLRGKAGKKVRLRVRDAAGSERDVLVEAVSMSEEGDLRYDEWEYTRRLETERRSEGSLGYVHLRAMGSGNIAEWAQGFYPVFNRAGLIIDVRHNNGGNIEAWILADLLKQAWMYFKGRSGDPFWNMHFAFRGHVVVLVNERTASDGEAFADGFRRLGLGDVIGTRTWGGEVWLSGSNRQVDGGVARASEGGVYGPDGDWLIEGWGVVPDVVVDNLPHETYGGRDAQLEAAIAHLQRLIAQDPRPMPQPPPYPVVVPGEGFPTPWRGGR